MSKPHHKITTVNCLKTVPLLSKTAHMVHTNGTPFCTNSAGNKH